MYKLSHQKSLFYIDFLQNLHEIQTMNIHFQDFHEIFMKKCKRFCLNCERFQKKLRQKSRQANRSTKPIVSANIFLS